MKKEDVDHNDKNNLFRVFHINQFPTDRIFIYLDNNFHQKLFARIKRYKFKEFNRLFFCDKLNRFTFKLWRSRKHFIPLWFIVKLSEKFPEFSIQEFENNVTAYKGPSTSAIIKEPNLPLIEDFRLLKIVAHFLGDGSIGGGFGSKLPKGAQHSEYRNFNYGLLDSFQKDLSVFGDVPTTKNYNHGSVIIPNVIGYVLKHIYSINFDTFNSRIPEVLFSLPRELVASFLRAFGDDEGHVYDSSIDYYSNNKKLLMDILTLVNNIFPEIKTSTIKLNTKAGKNIKYYFTIYSDSQELYLNLIGFDHKQKEEDLIFNIRRKKNISYNKNPKQKILDLLKKNNLTAKQISRLLIIRHSTVLEYLNELKSLGGVEVHKKERYSNIWKLNPA